MYALLTGDLLSGLVSVLFICLCHVCFVHWRPAFGSCKCALLYVCVMYTLLTGDLLLGLVSVLCYMFVPCMLCSLATCFRVL